MGKGKTGLLLGKEEVRAFLNDVSDHVLKKYIDAGMPVRIEHGRPWMAHRDNIEEFFRHYTRKKANPREI